MANDDDRYMKAQGDKLLKRNRQYMHQTARFQTGKSDSVGYRSSKSDATRSTNAKKVARTRRNKERSSGR